MSRWKHLGIFVFLFIYLFIYCVCKKKYEKLIREVLVTVELKMVNSDKLTRNVINDALLLTRKQQIETTCCTPRAIFFLFEKI